MTFTTKKKQTPTIKMLDIADNLFEFLESSKIKFTENQLEDISLLLAKIRISCSHIKGSQTKEKTVKKSEPKKKQNKEK